MAEFTGKTVVITGAGSGIGRATALLFGRHGARLHVSDVDAEAAHRVAGEIAAAGGEASAHAVDVTDADAVDALAAAVFDADGGVDVLHNNAGVGHAGAVEDTQLSDWRRVIEVNLMGTINGIHAFVPRMLRQGRAAHIVNTASMLGLVASPELGPYTASKFGVVGLTEALDAELRPKGIRLSAVCPGIIDTAITRESTYRGEIAADAERIQRFYRERGASPDVVAEAVLTAIRRRRVIQPVPYSHVMPLWILHRISPRAAVAASRLTNRVIRR